jgi:flagellar hook-length control protein FliK
MIASSIAFSQALPMPPMAANIDSDFLEIANFQTLLSQPLRLEPAAPLVQSAPVDLPPQGLPELTAESGCALLIANLPSPMLGGHVVIQPLPVEVEGGSSGSIAQAIAPYFARPKVIQAFAERECGAIAPMRGKDSDDAEQLAQTVAATLPSLVDDALPLLQQAGEPSSKLEPMRQILADRSFKQLRQLPRFALQAKTETANEHHAVETDHSKMNVNADVSIQPTLPIVAQPIDLAMPFVQEPSVSPLMPVAVDQVFAANGLNQSPQAASAAVPAAIDPAKVEIVSKVILPTLETAVAEVIATIMPNAARTPTETKPDSPAVRKSTESNSISVTAPKRRWTPIALSSVPQLKAAETKAANNVSPLLALDVPNPGDIIKLAAPVTRIDDISLAGVQTAVPLASQALVERQLDLARNTAWLDELARDIANAGNASDRLSFRLMPQNLGRLDVNITKSDAGLSLHFSTSSDASTQIVSNAHPRLIEELRAQGIRVTDASISSTDSQFQSDARSQGRSQSGHPSAHLIETATAGAETDNDNLNSRPSGRFA